MPEGPPTKTKTKQTKSKRPVQTKPRTKKPSPPLLAPFEDRFERRVLGPNWRTLSPVWRIVEGQLCVRGARNRGAWLLRTLPKNASFEFDARSESKDGDLKAEFWGNGRSGATSLSYSDATSYLTIFGGWFNSKHALARLDEHGRDRLVLEVDPQGQDLRARPVEPGQTYHFKVERRDGKTVSWWVDGRLLFDFVDPQPLTGPGHDHFAFNNWAVPACYDNLKITPL